VLIKNKIKTKVFSLVLIIMFCLGGVLSSNKPAQAYWGEFPAILMHEAWVEVRQAFLDAMLKSLKQQANNLLRDRVRVLLTGKGNPLVITDYDDFIYGAAHREASLQTRDFFKTLSDGVDNNTAAMYDDIEDALLSPESELSTIDQYVQGGIDNVFDQNKGGGSQAVMAMATNDMNNPFGVQMRAQMILEEEEIKAQKKAEVEAIVGQGFINKKDSENNLVNLPGSVIAGITTKTETLFMDMINQARSPAEIIGTVAAGMLSKTIETGVADVTKPIDNQLRTINDNKGMDSLQKKIYGGFGTSK